jgi:hypothetical protein
MIGMTVVDDFKARQRAMGAAGDYATLSEYITHVGERVVAIYDQLVGRLPRQRASRT